MVANNPSLYALNIATYFLHWDDVSVVSLGTGQYYKFEEDFDEKKGWTLLEYIQELGVFLTKVQTDSTDQNLH